MNYLKYIFSDKKAAIYWIVYYSLLGLLFLLGFLLNTNNERQNLQGQTENNSIFGLLMSFVVIFAYVLFYTFSFINYRIQQTFIKKYADLIPKDSVRQVNIELTQSSYTMTAFRTNYYAKINPKSKLDTYTIFLINNNLGILGQIYDFGIFRRHLRPMIIPLTGQSILHDYKFSKVLENLEINYRSNDLIIDFMKGELGIKKIRIIDWNKQSTITNRGNGR